MGCLFLIKFVSKYLKSAIKPLPKALFKVVSKFCTTKQLQIKDCNQPKNVAYDTCIRNFLKLLFGTLSCGVI